tara:strand:- start:735 stop:1397 length:663 start_codon:yes stop_codon:yes gene_type:complete
MLPSEPAIIVEIDKSPIIESVICPAATQTQSCQVDSISNEQFELVLTSLENISGGVNTLPNGIYNLEIMSAILAAISSAIAAFTINYFYWKRVEKKKVVSKLALETINVLNEFEDIACKYWSVSYVTRHQRTYMIQENKITSCISLIYQYTKEIEKKLGKTPSPNIEPALQELRNFNNTMYEIAAGGDFKSKTKEKSPKKVSQISKKCTNLKAKLSSIAY